MRSSRTPLLLAILSLVQFALITAAPVPIPDESNLVEEEEGLLLLVPTMAVDEKGQPKKEEIEYELISIPSDVIKRTVREVTKGQAGKSADPTKDEISSIFISDAKNPSEDEEILIKSLPLSDHTDSDVTLQGSASGSSGYLAPSSGVTRISTNDLTKILSSLATTKLSAVSSGVGIAGHAKSALTTASQVGQTALIGGSQAVRWILQQKAAGLKRAAEFSGTGLQYAGRLTSALLKILLRVPAIKARILSEILAAGQPLVTAVSEVIGESADDIGDVFSSQTSVFRDSIGILFRLVQDVLALKGRIFASLTGNGLDKGANLINAGVRVGSAAVQTAGDVASAVGRGVGEIVQVASDVDFPAPPPFPIIKFPTLPTLTYADSHESHSYESKGVTQKYR